MLKAAAGAKGLVEPSYVYLPGVPGGKEIAEKTGVDFFSVPIELGVGDRYPRTREHANGLDSLTVPRGLSISSAILTPRRRGFWRKPSRA